MGAAPGFTLLHFSSALRVATSGYPRMYFQKPPGILPKPSVTFPVILESPGTLPRISMSLFIYILCSLPGHPAKSEIVQSKRMTGRIPFILNTDDLGNSLPLGNKKRHSFKK